MKSKNPINQKEKPLVYGFSCTCQRYVMFLLRAAHFAQHDKLWIFFKKLINNSDINCIFDVFLYSEQKVIFGVRR